MATEPVPLSEADLASLCRSKQARAGGGVMFMVMGKPTVVYRGSVAQDVKQLLTEPAALTKEQYDDLRRRVLQVHFGRPSSAMPCPMPSEVAAQLTLRYTDHQMSARARMPHETRQTTLGLRLLASATI